MAENQGDKCKGHNKRMLRKRKIEKLLTVCKLDLLEEDKTVLIKKTPSISVETCLKDLLEEIYKNQLEWHLVENGGVLSVPVEELRMANFPKPDRYGGCEF